MRFLGDKAIKMQTQLFNIIYKTRTLPMAESQISQDPKKEKSNKMQRLLNDQFDESHTKNIPKGDTWHGIC